MQTAQFELHAEIEQTHWWFVARRRIIERLIREIVPPAKDATIVDVGCGTGANIAALAADYRVVGLDTSRHAVELARARFPRIRFVCGQTPADLTDELARARAVLLMDVLEHVEDDFALFSEWLAATSPNTHFVITVPADMALWSPHDESFGHYRRYDLARFSRLWENSPVTPRLVSCFNSRLYPVVKSLRWLSRRRGRAAGKAGTDLHLPQHWVNRTLEKVLAGESERLVELLHGRRTAGYRRGDSLMAVLRREHGEIAPRAKPIEVDADYYDPVAREYVEAC